MYLEVMTVKSARVPQTGGYLCFTSGRERRKARGGGAGERRRGVSSTFLWWRILWKEELEIRLKVYVFKKMGPIGMEKWTVLAPMGDAAFKRKVF